jgi:hypothetical protein
LAGTVLLRDVYSRLISGKDYDVEPDLTTITDFMVEDSNPNYNFSNGISGAAWLLNYLHVRGAILLGEDYFDDIDALIAMAAKHFLGIGCYDHFQGAIGMMLTLLDRSEKNREILESLVDFLLNIRFEFNGFKVWKFVYLSDKSPEVFKISFGLSHGLPSLMVILAKLRRANIRTEECDQAIRELYAFMLSVKLKETGGDLRSLYPGYIEQGKQITYVTSLGWCYGDLGIAIALYLAGKEIRSKEMMEEAESIFLYYSDFDINRRPGIRDGCICHGAAGTMHLFRRMYLNTGNLIYKKSCDYWALELLKMADYDPEVGYMFIGENDLMESRTSLVDGTKGVGLVLASYLANEMPDWDACFLFS